jgi:hypothetical protein
MRDLNELQRIADEIFNHIPEMAWYEVEEPANVPESHETLYPAIFP